MNCKNGGHINLENARFCGQCGNTLIKTNGQEKQRVISIIVFFYLTIISFIAATAYAFSYDLHSFWTEVIVEILFALIIINFCLFDLKSILELFKIPKLDKRIWQFALIFPIISGLFIGYFMNELNENLFDDWTNSYFDYIDLENPFFWTFIFVAVLPPIFEELAFRGYLFNQFKKVTSVRVTIITTSFLFALIHFSILSMLWIFPFALVLGYLRNKYNTLWIPMLVHFIHNFTVICIDYFNVRFFPEEFLF